MIWLVQDILVETWHAAAHNLAYHVTWTSAAFARVLAAKEKCKTSRTMHFALGMAVGCPLKNFLEELPYTEEIGSAADRHAQM